MNRLNDFEPNWASAPGDTIVDLLKAQKLSLDTFAKKIKCTLEFVHELINGQVKITLKLAKELESTLGASAEFWVNRESQYRDDLIRLEKSDDKEWLNELPISDMIKFGWIKKSRDMVSECLKYFDVPDVKTWRKKYEAEIEMAAFRTSNSFKSDHGAVATWFRQGEIRSYSLECNPWNESLFEKNLIEIRKLTRKKNPKDFIPELIKACAECGVSVSIVRTPSGCRASGATKFVSPERALLMLSFRYLSDDQFWFTFFHEAGHIMLHSNKRIFIEEIEGERKRTEEEIEANIFAGEMLIPHDLHKGLEKIRGNKRNIINFAMLAGVSPGIVVGQLQYLGYIDHKYLNSYKRRYKWEDIENV